MYNGFAREVPRPAPIRMGVKAGQYKRTFTGSLHFYELDAATTPLQPSTECRKPSTSSVSLFVSSLFLPVTRTVNSYPIPSLFLSSYLLPTPRHRLSRLFLLAPTLYQSTWHLCVTSGLWRHLLVDHLGYVILLTAIIKVFTRGPPACLHLRSRWVSVADGFMFRTTSLFLLLAGTLTSF